MFFYEQKVPTRGTIVIATMNTNIKDTNCIYVTLPEYNNSMGIIYYNELPRRLKQQKKAISDMERAGQIVCSVNNNPVITTDGNVETVELSIKNIDTRYHAPLCVRYKNIEKILKIIKFISMKFTLDYYDLVLNLQKTFIKPLSEIDENEGIDTFDALYTSCLRDINSLIKIISLDNDLHTQATTVLRTMIKETNATSSLMFDIFVWKGDSNGRDAVNILQSLFGHIKDNFTDKSVDVRYIGAPRYQLCVNSIAINDIDDLYSNIRESIVNWMTDNNITCYDLQFDESQKEIVPGDVSITFPFQINMTN